MEGSTQPNPELSAEQALVDREIRQAELAGQPISATTARIIASWWHGGQSRLLYSFQSTGAIDYCLGDEISQDYRNPQLEPVQRRKLEHLLAYILTQDLDENGERGPVEGWHEMTKDWGDRSPQQDQLFSEAGDGTD